MQVRAAVTRAPNAPMSLETLELDDPRAGEILVRVVATGVCHDLEQIDEAFHDCDAGTTIKPIVRMG